MTALTLIWIVLPLFIGFSIYLLPRFDRWLAIAVSIASIGYGLSRIIDADVIALQLLDNFGVTLLIDSLSGYFILTNALVTTAVILYCWRSEKKAFFFTQAIILHGSVNAVFVCADLMSLYVALEVIGIAAFLLIAYARTNRAIWVGLRYLFISNIAMLFYLVGAILVYQANNSFAFAGLRQAPTEAIALIFLGLLSKGGIFVSGLWLPLTHAEAETPVSAMLSGTVVKTGVFPIVRCALMMEELVPMLQFFSIGTALLGILYAVLAPDTKRTLAWSTISQMGFILAVPSVAGLYALSHGVAKAILFLIAGNLPSRDFDELRKVTIPRSLWLGLTIAGLSVAGMPLLGGFGTKTLVLKSLDGWLAIGLNFAALGTAMIVAKFVFLPPTQAIDKPRPPTFWLAIGLLVSSLVLLNLPVLATYNFQNIAKAILTIGAGWLAYQVVFRRVKWQLPHMFEQFNHLVGVMSLVLVLLFWMVMA